MRRSSSKRLVIDASVIRSAGGEAAAHPTSKRCRDFLIAVLDICHRMAVSPDTEEEWKRHRSRFASTWRTSMVARRKVVRLDSCADQRLRDRVERLARLRQDLNEAVLRKDIHLVEAAKATDSIVVSLDDTAKGAFRLAAGSIRELRGLRWINPDDASGEVIAWLASGAGAHAPWLLGST